MKASATKGDALLQQILKIEDANRIGEATIGTNYGITKFVKTMALQEKKNYGAYISKDLLYQMDDSHELQVESQGKQVYELSS
ncbi:MAG: hypothetical protein NWE91_01335 [Candidatus Bathyarchaeota archaeon]|nr:hypothetical protein [Candidatus Bathyarchaeota archaeon]